MEEADNTFGLDIVAELAPERKKYKCANGHELETNGLPLHFTIYQDNTYREDKCLGTTNPLCGECIIEWVNRSFSFEEVK